MRKSWKGASVDHEHLGINFIPASRYPLILADATVGTFVGTFSQSAPSSPIPQPRNYLTLQDSTRNCDPRGSLITRRSQVRILSPLPLNPLESHGSGGFVFSVRLHAVGVVDAKGIGWIPLSF